MRNTLLTTTALVLTAGIASADGHATITWSGAATAGVARAGSAEVVAAGKAAAVSTAGKLVEVINATTGSAGYFAGLILELNLEVDLIKTKTDAMIGHGTLPTVTSTSATNIRSDIVALRKIADAALVLHPAENAVKHAEVVRMLNVTAETTDVVYGSAATVKAAAGDWNTYSEVNATVTGAVVTDNGFTLSAGVSVDAGSGYDFADDDGFDAAKTNGVSLDSVSLAMGAMGTLTLNEDAVTHLVDGDDDATGDLKYTNTFGSATLTAVMDLDKDGDTAASKAGVDTITYTSHGTTASTYGSTVLTKGAAAVAADVAWSAKISMPVAGGSAYVAMDEEGGNIFGASTTLSGIGISFSSKLEALEEELSSDRENNIGLTYALGATTLGATWNSKEDGDQWGISAAYSADGTTISASTDEGSDWSVSGSMALASGASVVAGTNYTEDAYLGLSFAF